MTAPEDRTGFAARCAELCPGFRVAGPVQWARKSELLPGEIGGEPVIAKRRRKPNAVWDWYFAREVAVYRTFLRHPPPAGAPRPYAIADDVIVIERFPAALAKLRRPYAELAPAMIERLCDLGAILRAHPFPEAPLPPPPVTTELRRRLLEDPTDPTWIAEGLGRCGTRGLIDDHVVAAAREALSPNAASHGDLLLRNVMLTADGRPVLVDWECAGRYLQRWDRALLWTQLGPASREVLEAGWAPGPLRELLALAVFALCRELVFLDAFRTPADHAGRARVQADLDEVARRLSG